MHFRSAASILQRYSFALCGFVARAVTARRDDAAIDKGRLSLMRCESWSQTAA